MLAVLRPGIHGTQSKVLLHIKQYLKYLTGDCSQFLDVTELYEAWKLVRNDSGSHNIGKQVRYYRATDVTSILRESAIQRCNTLKILHTGHSLTRD